MSTVISVENVTKTYRLGQIGGGTLKEDVSRWWAKMRGRPDPFLKIGEEHHARKMGEQFWALNDVSFQVRQGEVLGVIGRNGAGKSTLLKILSQVTTPTSGQIKLKGRIASLLEVGTGFHPELTGRENVFLNGAILGMTKAEIRKKFDEIVAFSGIEEFIDTPVKRYSSGMYVRLAFAVAAHLEPEILIVDEVLAVGDADFQKKCMGKMQDVSKNGRTILFVSHNMAAVGKLCDRCILMNAGQVQFSGPTSDVLSHYLKIGEQSNGFRIWDKSDNPAQNTPLEIQGLKILDPDGVITGHVDIRKSFTIEIEYRILKTLPQFRIALRVITTDGTVAFTTSESADPGYETKPCGVGHYIARCLIPGNLLNEGYYSLMLSADIPGKEVLFIEEGAMGFSVEQTGGVNSRFVEKWPGVVCPSLKWETESVVKKA
jgi:lipopolysaccharide transport system ATP-binding protein